MTERASIEQDIDAALAETERAGLRVVLNIRLTIVVLAGVLIVMLQGVERGLLGAGVAFVFLSIGLVYRWVVQARRDRIWMRYAFVSADIFLIGVIAVFLPLAQDGEVPQIFVFRVYGIGIMFFVLATSALSLSPGLVLWSGAAIIMSIWASWGWIVWQMDRVVRWSDYASDPTAENYVRIVLDPDAIFMANRVTETIVVIATAVVTAAAVQRARTLLRRRIASERERAEVAEVFGRFVPEEVADTLSHTEGVLPPSRRRASVMFVDIAGFTTLSETLEPVQLTALLDAFFDTVGEIVTAHRGVCISLIGDAALVAFNAPLDNPDHGADAIAAATELLRRTEAEQFEGHKLSIRIGIATGDVAAGTIGGRGRRTYTLYGDTVNLAQRLESLNKERGSGLLIDAATWDAAGQPASLVHAGGVAVRGRTSESQLYTPQAPS
ncbi:MAG: adenylate/guanylate cyclase domain-containing protein [Pseudomonadota bacterium]